MKSIDALIAAMTVEEKIGQLTMWTAGAAVTGPAGAQDLPGAVRDGRIGSVLNLWGTSETRRLQDIATAESRHGIPLIFGLDVIHGFKTIFPIPLGEASAFNDGLWERTAREAAGEAARAGIHLTFAPMLDIARDPRWGRIAEGPGEDPYLAARFARAKVRGFQGAALGPGCGIAATAKHLAAYGAAAAGREYASADISERTLLEVYLPPFRAAVEAGAAAIMPAFNDIAGVPMSANRRMLREIVREQWGFEGVYISDYNAVTELIKHGVAADIADAAALALKAGIDIDMMGGAYEQGLPLALRSNPALMADIDASVRRVLELKATLGLFDAPYGISNEPEAAGAIAARRALARDAAARSIVLLTNRGALPLDASARRIAVVGPLATAAGDMLGSWSAAGSAEDAVTILNGLRVALPHCDIGHASGASISGDDQSGIAEAVRLVLGADVTVLCAGESAAMSGEAASRTNLGLPGRQEELARAVLETGKPVIVVLSSGRPLTLPWLMERAAAVLATWQLGSEAGNAIADVLTGRCNPSGRLPVSWPRNAGQVPIFHSARPTGRPISAQEKYTSKYLDSPNEPQFAFGHGLSYTQFRFSNLRAGSAELRIGDALSVAVDVTNSGARAGEETVLVFLHDVVASIAQPALVFKASAKTVLEPGETKTVELTLPADAFEFIGIDLVPITEPGEFEILVGPRAERDTLLRAMVRLL